MQSSLLNANADTAGSIFSSSLFEIPRYQRQYAWGKSELEDFWRDLQSNMDAGHQYFLGLVIMTEGKNRQHIVDGQQRFITLSLLAACLYHTAIRIDRKALADRLSSTFLYQVDYQTDASVERVMLSEPGSNKTFRRLLDLKGSHGLRSGIGYDDDGNASERLIAAYSFFADKLEDDLRNNSFKRLGAWAEFLIHRLYFAVFMHDDQATAYQVFEVINTRGRDLTTADLLKNFVMSKASPAEVDDYYERWEAISVNFPTEGSNNFVQYIRHVITSHYGHVLPRELYRFLIGRSENKVSPPGAHELLELLEDSLEPYLQMIDPSLSGPASERQLRVFSALNQLNVIALRPILLSGQDSDDPDAIAEYVLRLAVRRMVVGNLGTGNIDRRFGEAARALRKSGDFNRLSELIGDLNPRREEFAERAKVRILNKGLLSFLRRSGVQRATTPGPDGVLQWIWQPHDGAWSGVKPSADSAWAYTLGNSALVDVKRRFPAENWGGWRSANLPHVVADEERAFLENTPEWNAKSAEKFAELVIHQLVAIWYPQ